MDWACEVDSDSSGFHIVCEDLERRRRTIGLTEIISHGLPNTCGKRQLVSLDLEAGQPRDAEEYLRAFGFRPSARCSQHLVFDFETLQGRFLVPALAIMRALFRPAQYLLPSMFAPQALDHIRFAEPIDDNLRIRVHASWHDGRLRRYGDVVGPLTWMTFFPSAAAMAASVHAFALRGIIGLTPPRAVARLSATGVKIDETTFVTHISMVDVNASEPPIQGAAHCSPRIVYHAVARGGSRRKSDASLPLRPDGTTDVTDPEWDAIRPILLGRTSMRRFKLDQRRIFDGVLRKLSSGSSWGATDYPEGGRTNALYAWRSWSRSGRWDDAIAQLAELRQDSQAAGLLAQPLQRDRALGLSTDTEA